MSLLLLVVAFVATGLTMIATKLVVAIGLGDYVIGFVLLCAASAAVSSAAAFAFTRPRVEKKDIVVGLVMGASGGVAMVTLMLALRLLPAVTVFPVRASANIALTAAAAFAIWRERLTPRQWLGVALSIAAVYLLV